MFQMSPITSKTVTNFLCRFKAAGASCVREKTRARRNGTGKHHSLNQSRASGKFAEKEKPKEGCRKDKDQSHQISANVQHIVKETDSGNEKKVVVQAVSEGYIEHVIVVHPVLQDVGKAQSIVM